MSLILKLEEMDGDNIGQTCQEMCRIAERLNVCVQVKFNDVTLMSYRGGDPRELAMEFADQSGRDHEYKFASVKGDT